MLKVSKSMPSIIEHSYDYLEKIFKSNRTSARFRTIKLKKRNDSALLQGVATTLEQREKNDPLKLCEKRIIPHESTHLGTFCTLR